MTSSPNVLEADELTVVYGGLTALDQVTLQVQAGHVVGLIGPNGAGKTTLIDSISGFTPLRHGHLRFDGDDIGDLRPHERARRGLVRTFQSLELFDDLSVRQNLLVAGDDDERIDRVLERFGLADDASRFPTELSNGARHLVALARALVEEPRLLLLDEPAAGLDPVETAALADHLRALPAHGTSVLLVDHDMSLIMDVCDQVTVLDFGRVIASGAPSEVRADPEVVAAYLGRPREDPS